MHFSSKYGKENWFYYGRNKLIVDQGQKYTSIYLSHNGWVCNQNGLNKTWDKYNRKVIIKNLKFLKDFLPILKIFVWIENIIKRNFLSTIYYFNI